MHSIAWWPTVFVLAVASIWDLRTRRIPNWLVLPFLCVGVVLSGVLHGWHGIGQSLSGLVLGATVYGIVCWLGGMGMGDVKLCAAIGAWIGPHQLLIALLLISLVGGVMAILWAVFSGFLGELFSNVGRLFLSWKDHGVRPHPKLVLSNPATRKMPYAPAIALGTLASFFAR